MEPELIKALHFSDYTDIDFRGENGNAVEVYVAYYATQAKGESIHTPATCLPGNGWVFKESGTVALPISGGGGDTVSVKRDLIQKYDTTDTRLLLVSPARSHPDKFVAAKIL